jgi:hypothetical protein
MSVTDYRQLIDIHGGDFIGVECTDGRTIELSVNGTAMKLDIDMVEHVVTRLRARMLDIMDKGMNAKLEFGFGTTTTQLTYFDAGQVLDAIIGAARFLT